MRLEIQRPLGNKRRGVILVVDDERPLLTALERQFKLAGYHPLTVTTIADAWKLLDSWVVHCVVADERIPDGSGAYFLIDVGRKFGGIGRILLSGFVEPLLLDLGQEHRFPVLDKACRFSELLRAVKNELGDA